MLGGYCSDYLDCIGQTVRAAIPLQAVAEKNEPLGLYQTQEIALASLSDFLRSFRSSVGIVVHCCSKSQPLNEYIFRLLSHAQGLKFTYNSEGKTVLKGDQINICVIDSLDETLVNWAETMDKDATEKTRFIVLKEPQVHEYFEKMFVYHVERPFIATNFVNVVHEALIRYVLGIAKASESQTFPNSPLKPIVRNLAASFPMKMMVAEDSELNLKVLLKTLEKLGYSDVVVAHDGQEALAQYIKHSEEGHPVELIFMDMSMPVMDGCESSAKIREYVRQNGDHNINGPHIIAMTANTFIEDQRACLRSGMCCFTSKPVAWELLERVISEGYSALKGEMTCKCQRPFIFSW